MKNYIILACLLAFVGCSSTEPPRAERLSPKGMELYSWKSETADWHFNLFFGSNRQKPVSMMTNPKTAVVNVDELKQMLSELAKGELVFWKHMDEEPVSDSIVKDLMAFCNSLNINLREPENIIANLLDKCIICGISISGNHDHTTTACWVRR